MGMMIISVRKVSSIAMVKRVACGGRRISEASACLPYSPSKVKPSEQRFAGELPALAGRLDFPLVSIIKVGEGLTFPLSARTLLLDKNEASQYTSVNLKLFGYVLHRTFSRNHVERDKSLDFTRGSLTREFYAT